MQDALNNGGVHSTVVATRLVHFKSNRSSSRRHPLFNVTYKSLYYLLTLTRGRGKNKDFFFLTEIVYLLLYCIHDRLTRTSQTDATAVRFWRQNSRVRCYLPPFLKKNTFYRPIVFNFKSTSFFLSNRHYNILWLLKSGGDDIVRSKFRIT